MRRTRRSSPRLRIAPVLGLLAALLLPLGITFAPRATAAPAAADPVRVMPLGDSITGSPGCWRAVLWNRLLNSGYTDIDFVGTLPPQGCGQAHDGDNEGHGGELVTNVADQNLLPGRLAATRGFSTATDTYDGVHPNASGDDKIAARWFPALSAVLDAGIPQDPGGPGDPGEDPAACTARFRAVSSWQGGYQGEVTVTNTSASAASGWTATVVPAGGARLTQVWNATHTTAADGTATVTNAAWNGALAPGASATFGFVATAPATAGAPAATVTCMAKTPPA
jgi:hypothetical protein